jgi:type IV secretory pathway VirB10-like protein
MADLGRDLAPFARDPHAAQMMVERMFRTLGRATSPVWEGPAVSTSTRTPIHSAPIRAATPMPSMQHDAMPTLKKKRSGMVIGIVAGLCIAAGGVALYATSRGEEPETKTESKAATTDPPAPAPKENPPADHPAKVDPAPTPTPTATPPAPQDDEKATEPKPDPTEAKVADEGHKAQTKKAQTKKAQTKKAQTPTVEKTVKPPEPDPKSDRDKLAEPQSGGKVDVYANPRPKPRAN